MFAGSLNSLCRVNTFWLEETVSELVARWLWASPSGLCRAERDRFYPLHTLLEFTLFEDPLVLRTGPETVIISTTSTSLVTVWQTWPFPNPSTPVSRYLAWRAHINLQPQNDIGIKWTGQVLIKDNFRRTLVIFEPRKLNLKFIIFQTPFSVVT